MKHLDCSFGALDGRIMELEIEDPRLEQLLEDDHGARKWPYDAIRTYFPNIFQSHFSMDVSKLWQLPWLLKCHILSPKLCEKKGDSDRAGNGDTSGLYLAGYSWTWTMLDPNFPKSGGFKNLQMSSCFSPI